MKDYTLLRLFIEMYRRVLLVVVLIFDLVLAAHMASSPRVRFGEAVVDANLLEFVVTFGFLAVVTLPAIWLAGEMCKVWINNAEHVQDTSMYLRELIERRR